MIGKSHFRVRGVKCGKCERIHTWYKYRVWREGSRVKEEYIGKCDQYGNDVNFDAQSYWKRIWEQWEKTNHWQYTYRRQQAYRTPQPERKRTPYEILGVSYTATTEEITRAYKTLVKKYHPDLNPSIDQRIITEINVAYHILTH
jgi:preprotein translocase subunit Sec63